MLQKVSFSFGSFTLPVLGLKQIISPLLAYPPKKAEKLEFGIFSIFGIAGKSKICRNGRNIENTESLRASRFAERAVNIENTESSSAGKSAEMVVNIENTESLGAISRIKSITGSLANVQSRYCPHDIPPVPSEVKIQVIYPT